MDNKIENLEARIFELEKALAEAIRDVAIGSNHGSWWNDSRVYGAVKKYEKILGRTIMQ